MAVTLLPENAPFTAPQRAWLNGFFAGLLGLDGAAASATPGAAPVEVEEDFPWHDETLVLDERMKLAEGRAFPRQLMAAMGQLDCGQCGYLCQSYAEKIADGSEKDLSKCVPGGKPTQKMIKVLLAKAPAPAVSPAGAAKPAVPAAPVTDMAPGMGRDRPHLATLVASRPLNAPDSEKQTQNVVISLAGSGIAYEPGDSLGVWAGNLPEEVDLVLTILRARGSEQVTLADGTASTAREALTRQCNLREPSDELYQLLSRHAKNDIEATRLARLAEDGAAAAEHGVHDVFDVLTTFRSARPTVAEFVQSLGKLQPRLYSIASSLKAHPDEVHLTVAVVRYALHRRDYGGVASNFFAERLRPGQRVPVYIQVSHGFRLPADDVPVIMIGPGTGVAPFRAFLEERAARGATGRNWLFFGNQRREQDFLYREEFEAHLKSGVLTNLHTAFSRDQAQKVYVQDRMLEQGRELWAWLDAGACFYVCGDAQRMARDVDTTLKLIAVQHGGLSEERAAEYVKDLAAAGRYLRDVY
jgi:sulfite reductase (NADPH) flavoprotein alpha-component